MVFLVLSLQEHELSKLSVTLNRTLGGIRNSGTVAEIPQQNPSLSALCGYTSQDSFQTNEEIVEKYQANMQFWKGKAVLWKAGLSVATVLRRKGMCRQFLFCIQNLKEQGQIQPVSFKKAHFVRNKPVLLAGSTIEGVFIYLISCFLPQQCVRDRVKQIMYRLSVRVSPKKKKKSPLFFPSFMIVPEFGCLCSTVLNLSHSKFQHTQFQHSDR